MKTGGWVRGGLFGEALSSLMDTRGRTLAQEVHKCLESPNLGKPTMGNLWTTFLGGLCPVLRGSPTGTILRTRGGGSPLSGAAVSQFSPLSKDGCDVQLVAGSQLPLFFSLNERAKA